MTTPFNIEYIEDEKGLTLFLEGDLDESSFLAASQSLAKRAIRHPIRVDLQKIHHVDSTGLRALVLLQRQVSEADQELILIHPSPSVKRLFRVTGLSQVFQIAPDDAETSGVKL